MKKLSFINYTLLCTITMSMYSLSGCTDKEDIVNSTDFEEKLAEFNFSTSQDKSFDLSLGINAKNNVVNLYSESVTLETAANSDSFLGSFFLNGDGCFLDSLKVPNHVTKVWMTFPNSPEFGVVTAEVNDGNVVLDLKLGGLKSKSASRRASIVPNATTETDALGNITTTSDYGKYTLYNQKNNVTIEEINTAALYKSSSTYKKDDMGGIYSIVEWKPTYGKVDGVKELTYHYGGFVDTNNLKDSNSDLSTTGTYFVNKFKTLSSQSAFKNVSDDIINIDIKGGDEETVDEHGAIKIVSHEKVELEMTFIVENANYCNCFGYYYYKTGEAPTTVADGMKVDKFIIFPNASMTDQQPFDGTKDKEYSVRTIATNYAPIKSGDRIKLLFKDEDGNVSTWFPAGYTVGFFLIPNAYDSGWNNVSGARANGIDYTRLSQLNFTQNSSFFSPDYNRTINSNMICSNVKMNDSYQPENLRYVSFNETVGDEEYIIFGVEDGTDFSYSDMVFTIESSDPWMTHRNRLTEWTESKAAVGVYAFEDVWPEGTDYDMNDALISHTRTRTFDSENYLSEVTDYFELISDIDAAALSNTFCIQIPTAQQGSEITFDGDIQTESETNSFIIFKNINEAINSGKKKVSITRKFNEKNIKADKLTYSPYLISNGATYMGQDRVEIHMAGDKVTTYGKKVYSDDKSNWYTSRFISGDGLYPYALTIPLKDWKSPNHNIKVSDTFLKFSSWVNSLGKKDTDWYKNEKGYDVRVIK